MTTLSTIASAMIEVARERLYQESISAQADSDFVDYLEGQIAAINACATVEEIAATHFVQSLSDAGRDPNGYPEGIPTYGVEV